MSKTLYVGNLPYQADERSLTEYFESTGANVNSVKIILDRDTGRSRGFGFVEIDTDDIGSIIESLDGQEFDGRRLNVREAHDKRSNNGPRRSNDDGYGGGGRGGRGNRRGNHDRY